MRITAAIAALTVAFSASAEESAKQCVYSYKPDSVKVFWTGYKFTDKKGARGEFKDLKVTSSPTAASAEDLIQSTSIEINPTAIDSGDPGRDSNLQKYFFKLFKGPKIKGTVSSYSSPILKVKTEVNGVSKVIAYRVTVDGAKYLAETDFDMMDFKLKKAHASIEKACKDVHKGPDGKSKTWTQVSVAMSAEIVNSCDPVKTAGQ